MKAITDFFIKYAMVLAGLAITAFGVMAFIVSNDIMIGSTTGLGRIGEHFLGVPVSVAVAMIVGNTILHGERGYEGTKTDVIMCITNGRELHSVQTAILDIDPEAFITISSVKEVKGRGYSFDHGLAKQMRKEQGK